MDKFEEFFDQISGQLLKKVQALLDIEVDKREKSLRLLEENIRQQMVAIDQQKAELEYLGYRFDHLKEKIEKIPQEPLQGEKGEDGKNGLSAYELALDTGYIGSLKEWLESLKGKDGLDGLDGQNGKDGDDGQKGLSAYEIDVQNGYVGILMEWLQSLKGERGTDGVDGQDGVDGHDGQNGLSAYDIAVQHGFSGSELDWLNSLRGENGRDGINGQDGRDGKDGRDGRDGKDGNDGLDGKDGRDGEAGRDALQIEILNQLDPLKSYPRGTYISHASGLIRSFNQTTPLKECETLGMAGWEVLVNGISEMQCEIEKEGRTLTLHLRSTNGLSYQRSCVIPSMIYRGIYKEGHTYEVGDMVTWGGSLWHCEKETNGKPELSTDWKLAAKRGRDGRDGKNGVDGKPPLNLKEN